MKYEYFISFYYSAKGGDGFGRWAVTTDGKIECPEDIEYLEKELKKELKKECSVKNVVIINYQLMRVLEKGE